MKNHLLFFLCLLSAPLFAQTSINPNCSITATFTGSGQSTPSTTCGSSISNPATMGLITWNLVYYVDGFSAVSVVVQSAPDANGSPGSWGTFSGTVNAGSNPSSTVPQSFATLTGYNPWVRVALSSVTGSGKVVVKLYASFTGSSTGGGGGGGGCTAPCAVEGTAASGSPPVGPPVLVGGSDGTDVRTLKTDATGQLKVVSSTTATSDAAVTVTTSGLTQILAASGSTVITVYHISLGFASGVNFQLESGTGSNCGTSTAAVTGVYQAVAGIALDVPFSLPAGTALCVNLGSSVTGGGLLVYTQL